MPGEPAHRLPQWMLEFQSFGPLHLLTASGLIALMLAALLLGRRWRGSIREQILRRGWIGFTLIWQAYAVIWYLLPANFDLRESLPLHVCDLVAWIAPFALLTQRRLLRSLLFFWGLGLSTQAFVTPVVSEGVDSMHFWLFWVGHTQIVGSAVYDVGVLGYRPRWRDYLQITIVNLVCIGLILPFDLLIDANYWYIGRSRPDHPTLLDALGPWPWRVLWMVLIAQSVLAVLCWVFNSGQCTKPPQRPIHSTQ